MEKPLTLFIGTFTTLLAVINPLESLPIYLELLQGQDDRVHRRVARQACLYAAPVNVFLSGLRHFNAQNLFGPTRAWSASSAALF